MKIQEKRSQKKVMPSIFQLKSGTSISSKINGEKERKEHKWSFVKRCLRWNWYIDEVLCSRKGKGGGYVWGDESWRENCDGGKWFSFVLIKKLINYLTEIIICTISWS